jgi:hypothetical protein
MRDGSIVGIEVKAGASVRASDFSSLAHVRQKAGDRFRRGVILYAGKHSLPFGDRLNAVPLSHMWS